MRNWNRRDLTAYLGSMSAPEGALRGMNVRVARRNMDDIRNEVDSYQVKLPLLRWWYSCGARDRR